MKTLEEIKKNLSVSVNDEAEDGIAGFINLHDKKGKIARFVASWGGGWDHVSVSYPNRCPTWDEMHAVKDMFFDDEEVCGLMDDQMVLFWVIYGSGVALIGIGLAAMLAAAIHERFK